MQTLTKYLVSYLKRDWNLEDYPIEIRHSDVPANVPEVPDFRPIPWLVRIPTWMRMTGYGDTMEEAYADLRRKFSEYKNEGNELPRPGTKVPIQFAPMVEITKYEQIAEDFFSRILQMDYHNVLITDSSSLWHFQVENEEVKSKILEVYGVDISEIEDGNIAEIFRKIDQR